MVARAVVGIPTLLCLWISEIIASLPGRCAVTVLELLTGTMLTGYGSISQAILAVPCRRHWTSYYWMVRKGKFDWKVMVHALCRIVKREFPSKRCVVVGDDTLIPRVSEAAPGAAIQYDHARKPNRPDYILAQTVVSLSAVIGNSWGSWSVPLMSNLAVRTGNHGKLETMRALVEEVSGTLGAITLLLDAWYMKRYLIVDVLTRDAIVIGQIRRDTALYEPPPSRTGKTRTAPEVRRSDHQGEAQDAYANAHGAADLRQPPDRSLSHRRLQGPLPRRSTCPSSMGINVRRWKMDSGTASAVH